MEKAIAILEYLVAWFKKFVTMFADALGIDLGGDVTTTAAAE